MNLKKTLGATALCLSMHIEISAQESAVQADDGQIKITPLVHSSVQIEYNGFVIQVDPWNVLGLTNALPADIILISDDVGHHLDTSAIAKLRKSTTQIIMPQSGVAHIPDGKVLNNGEIVKIQGVTIESIEAYDIIPGEPSHLRGDANGYLVEIGGKRIFLAGVTECVPEILALKDIDIAFMPMNIPPGRMTPAAAAECTRALQPDVVFLYHYDQGYAARATRPNATVPPLPGNLTVAQTVEIFEQELAGSNIEFRQGEWYPALP
ncbi:MAG: MBL fold metallo-hydrolase [Pseudohongiella sp.]|nr:MBL fold metallo-hydrolase [Pseudohongiella sp.]